MATACAWTITLLYIYLCVWELDLRLNNVNYSYWYFPSSIIIISLYWTSETPLSSSITISEYLICDREHATISYRIQGLKYIKCNRPHKSENLCGAVKPMKKWTYHALKQKKMICVHMFSSAPIAIAIIRQTLIFVRSGNTGSTINNITKNISRSIKTEQNQLAQL